MNQPILLTGLRPSHTPQMYQSRIDRLVSLQGEFRSFVLIADCQSISLGDLEPSDQEAAVEQTVRYLAALEFDCERSVCFLQSQIPQLAELSRLLKGFVNGIAQVETLACNSFCGAMALSEVADMLMFRPELILGGKGDRADFEVASTVVRTLGKEAFGEAAFEQIDEDPAALEAGESVALPERFCVRDVLNFGGSAARIEAQKTLEATRERLGLNYAMFG